MTTTDTTEGAPKGIKPQAKADQERIEPFVAVRMIMVFIAIAVKAIHLVPRPFAP